MILSCQDYCDYVDDGSSFIKHERRTRSSSVHVVIVLLGNLYEHYRSTNDLSVVMTFNNTSEARDIAEAPSSIERGMSRSLMPALTRSSLPSTVFDTVTTTPNHASPFDRPVSAGSSTFGTVTPAERLAPSSITEDLRPQVRSHVLDSNTDWQTGCESAHHNVHDHDDATNESNRAFVCGAQFAFQPSQNNDVSSFVADLVPVTRLSWGWSIRGALLRSVLLPFYFTVCLQSLLTAWPTPPAEHFRWECPVHRGPNGPCMRRSLNYRGLRNIAEVQ